MGSHLVIAYEVFFLKCGGGLDRQGCRGLVALCAESSFIQGNALKCFGIRNENN